MSDGGKLGGNQTMQSGAKLNYNNLNGDGVSQPVGIDANALASMFNQYQQNQNWNAANNTPPALPSYHLPAGIPAYSPMAQAPVASMTGGAPNHWLNAQNALGRQLNTAIPGLIGNTQGAQK